MSEHTNAPPGTSSSSLPPPYRRVLATPRFLPAALDDPFTLPPLFQAPTRLTLATMYSAVTFLLNHMGAIALSLLSIYFVIHAGYQLFFSPLSNIPGPRLAAISDLWLTTHVLRLQQCKIIHQLFEIYGPVVRVGPNKVVFKDLTTSKSVYAVHRFDKSPYYKSLLTYECSLFPTTNSPLTS